jgi:hypothetical protein
MKQTLILISSFTILFNLAAQKVFLKDINKDKKIDKVLFDIDILQDLTIVSVTDGATKKNIKMQNNFLYSSFVSFQFVEKSLITLNYPLSFLSKSLFNTDYSNQIDPALNWLLNTEKSKIEDNMFYEYKLTYQPQWSELSSTFRKNYHVKMKSSLIYNKKLLSLQVDTSENPFVWINYLGINHGASIEVRGDSINAEQTRLFTTKHGVYICQGDSLSWIFIGDSRVTENNDKLRWPSIVKAAIYADYVFILQNNTTSQENSLFVCNYKKGKIYKLSKKYFGLNTIDNFELKPDVILVNNGVEIKTRPIFAALSL